jgi:hypothetical protein
MRLAEYDQGRDAITYDAPAAIFLHTPRDTPEPEANCNAVMMAIDRPDFLEELLSTIAAWNRLRMY